VLLPPLVRPGNSERKASRVPALRVFFFLIEGALFPHWASSQPQTPTVYLLSPFYVPGVFTNCAPHQPCPCHAVFPDGYGAFCSGTLLFSFFLGIRHRSWATRSYNAVLPLVAYMVGNLCVFAQRFIAGPIFLRAIWARPVACLVPPLLRGQGGAPRDPPLFLLWVAIERPDSLLRKVADTTRLLPGVARVLALLPVVSVISPPHFTIPLKKPALRFCPLLTRAERGQQG